MANTMFEEALEYKMKLFKPEQKVDITTIQQTDCSATQCIAFTVLHRYWTVLTLVQLERKDNTTSSKMNMTQ